MSRRPAPRSIWFSPNISTGTSWKVLSAATRRTLLTGGDRYLHLADLTDFLKTDQKLYVRCMRTPMPSARMAITNVGSSGTFSSDRTIAQYASGNLERRSLPRTVRDMHDGSSRTPTRRVEHQFPASFLCARGRQLLPLFRHATGVDRFCSCRFTSSDAHPARVIYAIDPADRTNHYWHTFVPECEGRPDLRLPRGRDLTTPPWACVLIRRKVLARSLWPRRRGSAKLQLCSAVT